MILQQLHGSEHWDPNAEIHPIVEFPTVLLIIREDLHFELDAKSACVWSGFLFELA